MKAVKIMTSKPQEVASALVIAGIRFIFEYGEIYMPGTADTLKIRRLLDDNNAGTNDMVLEAVDYEL